jgi:hypothetical protein
VSFAERFGIHASNQLSDPLTLLAKSPVFETGEIQLVHQVDMDQFRELLGYVGLLVVGTQFSGASLRWLASKSKRKP